MKVEVRFTLEVPRDDLEKLRAVAESDTNADAAMFVRGEAEDTIKRYLEETGNVRSRTIKRDGYTVHEQYSW